ncbi:MAG: transcription initiation protein [Myxococcales bacterium]|nr:transcription initiation protein [Myxococcales bacterium]MCB9553932.1 transcription initiation protein [Myxococcales bacterium]
MAKYLVSFPSGAMKVPASELEAVGHDAHAVMRAAKAAGVYVFGGGIDETVPSVRVAADGSVTEGGYPGARPLDGGFTVLEVPSRAEAIAWAARFAKACRCDQELRVFGFDPES